MLITQHTINTIIEDPLYYTIAVIVLSVLAFGSGLVVGIIWASLL